MFDELRRVGIELFSDEPEVCERIELLYSEILTDEIGHVGYCASRCTAAERAIMRRIYPLVGRMFARQTAEISTLVDLKALHARLDRPFDVDELTDRPGQRNVPRRPPLTSGSLAPSPRRGLGGRD